MQQRESEQFQVKECNLEAYVNQIQDPYCCMILCLPCICTGELLKGSVWFHLPEIEEL